MRERERERREREERVREGEKSVGVMREDMSFDVLIDKKKQICRSFPRMGGGDVICSVYLRYCLYIFIFIYIYGICYGYVNILF